VSFSAVAFSEDRTGVVEGRVFADFFELTVAPDGFDVAFLGFGIDESATVDIDDRLTGGKAAATLELLTCDDLGCAPTGEMFDFAATFTGTGDIERFRQHSQFSVDGAHENTVAHGRLRAATASATVDGDALDESVSASLRTIDVNSNAN